MFRVIDFLQDKGIDFAEEGKNVKEGNVNINCPFCNGSDPSHHLGISLEGKGWACWRDQSHRGKSYAILIANLLHVPLASAKEILDAYSTWSASDGLLKSGKTLIPVISKDQQIKTPITTTQRLPKEFVDLSPAPYIGPFRSYLQKRGVSLKEAQRLGLKAALSGPYGRRVIFPIYENGNLLCWQGRTILSTEKLRYKGQSLKDGAIEPTTNTVWPYDHVKQNKGDLLLICEGPMDALKLNILGNKHGIYAICIFTAAISTRQIQLISRLIKNYNKVGICMDSDIVGIKANFTVQKALQLFTDPLIFKLPQGIKDAGELDAVTFSSWMGLGSHKSLAG